MITHIERWLGSAQFHPGRARGGLDGLLPRPRHDPIHPPVDLIAPLQRKVVCSVAAWLFYFSESLREMPSQRLINLPFPCCMDMVKAPFA